jgi:predicted dehydrogenase
LSDQFEIVGFTTFSAEGFRRFESKTGIRSFRNAEALVEQARPEILILAVPDRLNEQTALNLLDLKVPVLAETPLAWSVSGTRRIIEKAAANGVLLGVAEQFPFLPLEQFRKKLLHSGMLGDIYAAHNDFQSYSYHAIAQLRSYLNGKPAHVRCTQSNFRPSPINGLRAQWQIGSVTFDDGSLLHHNYASPNQIAGSIRIFGTLGAMDNYEIRLIEQESRQTEIFSAVRAETAPGHLTSISIDIPDKGKVVWANRLEAYPFSDEQIAVASLLNEMLRAIREGVPPLYSGSDFLADIEIVEAFRYSASRGGVDIRLPFRDWQQTALQLTSPSYLKHKLFKQ